MTMLMKDIIFEPAEPVIAKMQHPLVFGCTMYLTRNSTDDQPVSKEDAEKLAQEIIDYYSKKVMWLTIQDERISNFKTDMMKLFNYPLNAEEFPTIFSGIGYKLPMFYANDMKLDNVIMKDANAFVPEQYERNDTKTLEFIDTIVTGQTAKATQIEYWFKDQDNYRVRLVCKRENELRPMLEHLISKPFTVEASFYRKQFYHLSYYELTRILTLESK